MTSDPERLIDPLAGDPFGRELLLSLRDTSPPAGAKAEAWEQLMRQVALVGVVTSGASVTPGASGAGVATGAKSTSAIASSALTKLLVSVGVGAAGVGTWVAIAPGDEPPASLVAAPSSATAHNTVTPAREPPRDPETAAVPACAGKSCDERPVREPPRNSGGNAERTDALERESALLVRARAALRTGDLNGARAALSQLESRFPRGMLSQEREVLGIELLAARGDRGGARRRAQAFVAAHPNSPHSAKLARFLDP